MATEVEGFEGFQDFLQKMHDEVDNLDFTDALGEIVEKLEEVTQVNFGNRTSPDGEPWAESFFRKFGGTIHPTLEATGGLRGSLREGGDGNVFQLSGDSFEFGTDLSHAGIQQEGATIITGVALISRDGHYLPVGSRLVIPPRPFLGLSDEFIDASCEVVADHIIDVVMS